MRVIAFVNKGARTTGGTKIRLCTVCRRRKDKVHRNRRTGKLVCAACSDRARMQIASCGDCGKRKLIQARGRCYACYKRQWRAGRFGIPPSLQALAAPYATTAPPS